LTYLYQKEKENEYKVETSKRLFPSRCQKIVTFTTPDLVNLPLPSPTYLAIHAACAKVAHLSGATDMAVNVGKYYSRTLIRIFATFEPYLVHDSS